MKFRWTNELLDKYLIDNNSQLNRIDTIIDSRTSITFECSICHKTQKKSIDSVVNKKTLCKYCNNINYKKTLTLEYISNLNKELNENLNKRNILKLGILKKQTR